MTNLQLQIDFETKFNKLAGKTYLSLSLEEIDWYLNEAMKNYIFNILDRKDNKNLEDYTDTKENIDNLKALFTKVTLPVFKSDSETGTVIVPPNFLHLIEAQALIAKDCKNDKMPTVDNLVKYFTVEFKPTVAITQYNIKTIVNGNENTLVTLADIQNLSGTVPVDFNYVFIDRILQHINNNPDYSIYWENYDVIYKPNNFIIVYNGTGNLTSASVKFNAIADANAPIVSLTKQKINYLGDTIKKRCRLEVNEMAGIVNSNPFYKSKRISPVIFMFNGAILTKLLGFDISQLEITYIRRPKVIDYKVLQAIELGDTKGLKDKISMAIVDKAVALAAARLLLPNSQTLQQITS